MKRTIAILMVGLSISGSAQVTLTNAFWRFGTNGFNIFEATVRNSNPDTLYMWQTTTNIAATNWVNEFSGLFYGSRSDMQFTYVLDSGATNKLFRIVEVGQP